MCPYNVVTHVTSFPPAALPAFIGIESEEVGLAALPPSAQSNGSCGFPASRFPLLLHYWNHLLIRPGMRCVSRTKPNSPISRRVGYRFHTQLKHLLTALPHLPRFNKVWGLPLFYMPFEHAGATTPSRDPRPFALTSFISIIPQSDSWHRIGQNFAFAYICIYLPVAPGRCLCSLFLTLSSVSATISRPHLLFRQYKASLGHKTLLPYHVARKHPGTMSWNLGAFASIVPARPLLIFGRPVHH